MNTAEQILKEKYILEYNKLHTGGADQAWVIFYKMNSIAQRAILAAMEEYASQPKPVEEGKGELRILEGTLNDMDRLLAMTLTEVTQHLKVIENYLRGEHCHETDEIQKNEDERLYKETARLIRQIEPAITYTHKSKEVHDFIYNSIDNKSDLWAEKYTDDPHGISKESFTEGANYILSALNMRSTPSPTVQPAVNQDKDYWMQQYEILRRTMNMRDAVWEIVNKVSSVKDGKGIDLAALQGKFDAMFADPNILELFEDFVKQRKENAPPSNVFSAEP